MMATRQTYEEEYNEDDYDDNLSEKIFSRVDISESDDSSSEDAISKEDLLDAIWNVRSLKRGSLRNSMIRKENRMRDRLLRIERCGDGNFFLVICCKCRDGTESEEDSSIGTSLVKKPSYGSNISNVSSARTSDNHHWTTKYRVDIRDITIFNKSNSSCTIQMPLKSNKSLCRIMHFQNDYAGKNASFFIVMC